MASYTLHQDVLMQHCDISGLVFMPRYFDILHTVIENWFDEALQTPMVELHGGQKRHLPPVNIEAQFPRPTRLGEQLKWTLTVANLGRSSVTLALKAECNGETRVTATASLVLCETGALRPVPWPDGLRHQIEKFAPTGVAAEGERSVT